MNRGSLDGLLRANGCPIHDQCLQSSAEGDKTCCAVCGAKEEDAKQWQSTLGEKRANTIQKVMQELPGRIWYSTDSWFRRWLKFTWAEDVGRLDIATGRLQFVGRKIMLNTSRMRMLEVGEPNLP